MKLSRMGSLVLIAIAGLGISRAVSAAMPVAGGMPVAAITPALTPPSTRPVAAAVNAAKPAAGFEKEVAALEATLKKNNPAPGGVLFYGSSSIRLWKSVKDDFPGLNVINHGFGGSTCPDAIKYFDRLVVPVRPSTIVFYEGDNDLGKGRTAEQLFADYQAFAKLVHSKLPKTKVLFLSVKPSPKRAELLTTQRKVNAMLESWIKGSKDPSLSFVNVFNAMVDASGTPRAELFGPDKLHMTREGYKLWISKVAGVIGSTPTAIVEKATNAMPM
jgi:lysophospholipase L1-like esterase